ncbi:hypothetical protein E308F_05200 [Moorella sp. E308F]|nr:hypothetical protein E308F_05200 [Moorella sp. E308F]
MWVNKQEDRTMLKSKPLPAGILLWIMEGGKFKITIFLGSVNH